MFNPSRLTFSLVLVLGVAFSACDTVDAPNALSTSTVSLQTEAAPTGDVLYDLAPLSLGETFTVTAEIADSDVHLLATRTDRGYAVSFDPGTLTPTSVQVRYLYDGRDVATPRTIQMGAPMEAGESDAGPDSYHYVCNSDGICGTRFDYNNSFDGGQRGTRFTTTDGEVVTVTDVAFVPVGVPMQPPTTVRLESPRGVAITAEAFGRPIR